MQQISLTRPPEYRHVLPMRVQLIHNPASGTHHAVRLDVLAQAFEACGATVVQSQTQSDGRVALAHDSNLICVAGGDGTLRLVLAAMADEMASVPLCIFPSGTVNLVARELGYPAHPEQFASQVMSGYLAGAKGRFEEPIVTSDDRPFAACLSAGPDGVAVARHSPALKRRTGKFAYALSFLQLFWRWPRRRFLLTVETRSGAAKQQLCEAFYILKGGRFGGSWSLSPDAALGSDHFILISLAQASRLRYLRFLLAVARHKNPANLPFVDQVRAESLTIDPLDNSEYLQLFQIDGDAVTDIPGRVSMSGYSVSYCLPVDD